MTEVYDGKMREIMKKVAQKENITLKEGVYLQFTGPSFETPAEVRMAGMLGADVVGMSTACEAIAARHAGMKVCGLSFVSNPAAGLGEAELSHEDVQKASKLSAQRMADLIKSFCAQIK